MLLLAVLFAYVLTGCVKDDDSDCPDPEEANLIVRFEYFNLLDEDIFDDRIEMVDVIMFDQALNYYGWVTLDRTRLDQFRGVQLDVEPGEYYFVCWANNRSDRGETPGSGSLGGSYIYHYNPASADPLHYAPDKRIVLPDGTVTTGGDDAYKITVPPSTVKEDTMAFMSAHRTVNVYLKNFPGVDDPDYDLPTVSIDHLSEYYDFSLGRGPENAIFVQTTQEVTIEGTNYCFATFYIPHFDFDNNVNIVISGESAEGSYVRTVAMESVLQLYNIDRVYDGDDLVLDIEISWGNTLVTIEIPPFKITDVDPGFG